MSRNRCRIARTGTTFAAVAGAVLALTVGLVTPTAANAAVENSAPSAQVSFTFDDGFLSSLTEAAPTLQKHGLTGTNYVTTDCVGMTTAPNACRANPEVPYMTWDQIQQLQNTYGWEIGSHAVTHRCLVSAGNGCQADQLTAAEVEAELAASKSALAAHGIDATAFAPPYGDYDPTVMAEVAKHYSSMRGFADTGENYWPYSDYLLQNVPVQEGVTPVETLKAKVDEAIADQAWVVFTFHEIAANPSQDPGAYEFGTAELEELAAYVQTKVAAGQIGNVNVSDGLVTGTPNKMPNASFNSGIGEGWTTDAPTTITADAGGNGSYPDPTRSVKLVSGATTSHLFSPRVAVSPGTDYLYKTFLDVDELASGEVAFYVDEYDAEGNWVSGQYRTRENSRWVQELNFTYTPTSTDVAEARLQVVVQGTGITAYLDNVEMLALGAETPPPSAADPVANDTISAHLEVKDRTTGEVG